MPLSSILITYLFSNAKRQVTYLITSCVYTGQRLAHSTQHISSTKASTSFHLLSQRISSETHDKAELGFSFSSSAWVRNVRMTSEFLPSGFIYACFHLRGVRRQNLASSTPTTFFLSASPKARPKIHTPTTKQAPKKNLFLRHSVNPKVWIQKNTEHRLSPVLNPKV